MLKHQLRRGNGGGVLLVLKQAPRVVLSKSQSKEKKKKIWKHSLLRS
jgi:hypothetical protein